VKRAIHETVKRAIHETEPIHETELIDETEPIDQTEPIDDPFADLWCVTTAETDYEIACVFLARLVYIRKPRLIGAMSYIVSTAGSWK
jgi:hypothetical protein